MKRKLFWGALAAMLAQGAASIAESGAGRSRRIA